MGLRKSLAFEGVPQEVVERHYADLVKFPHRGLSREERDEAVRHLGGDVKLGRFYESYLSRQRGRTLGNRFKGIFGHVIDALT